MLTPHYHPESDKAERSKENNDKSYATERISQINSPLSRVDLEQLCSPKTRKRFAENFIQIENKLTARIVLSANRNRRNPGWTVLSYLQRRWSTMASKIAPRWWKMYYRISSPGLKLPKKATPWRSHLNYFRLISSSECKLWQQSSVVYGMPSWW